MPPQACEASCLHHHGGRLDDGGRRHPGLESELVDSIARHDGDDARGLGHRQLDLREQPLDAHLGHGAAQAVSRTHVLQAGIAAEPLDLLPGHEPPVRAVARRADAAVAIPAPERGDADPELPRRLGRGVRPLRHAPSIHIGITYVERFRIPTAPIKPPQTSSPATAPIVTWKPCTVRWSPPPAARIPRIAIARRPATRATALLTPEATPASPGPASASTVVVRGATVMESPSAKTNSAGTMSTQ